MKSTAAILLFGLLLMPAAIAACGVAGDNSQLIFRISSPTNAHVQLWDSVPAYTEEICYDDPLIFNEPYLGAAPHTCDGSNELLRLSDISNAHGDTTGAYSEQICYGDLDCTFADTSIGEDCDAGSNEFCIARLSSTTNAHVETCANTNYPLKLCCWSASAVGPASCSIDSATPSTIGENASTLVSVSYSGFTPAAVGHTIDCDDTGVGGLPVPGSVSCDPINSTCSFTCGPYVYIGPVNPETYTISASLIDSAGGSVVCTTGSVNVDNTIPIGPGCLVSSVETPIDVGGNSDIEVSFWDFNPTTDRTDELITCSTLEGLSYTPDPINCDDTGRGTCTFTCENYTDDSGPHFLSVLLDEGPGVGNQVICTSPLDVTVNPAGPSCLLNSISGNTAYAGDDTLDDIDVIVNYFNFTNPPLQDITCGDGGTLSGSCGGAGTGVCNFACENYDTAGPTSLTIALLDGATSFSCNPAINITVTSCGNGLFDVGEDCDPPGLLCAVPNVCQADCTCAPPAAGQGFLKITQFVTDVRSFSESDAANQFDNVIVSVKNFKDQVEDVRVRLEILDPETNLQISPPVEVTPNCGTIGLGQTCSIPNPTVFSIGDLPPGAYKLSAVSLDSSNTAQDQKFVYFTVGRPAPVPEFDLVLLPLIAFSVLAVLFFAGKRKS